MHGGWREVVETSSRGEQYPELELAEEWSTTTLATTADESWPTGHWNEGSRWGCQEEGATAAAPAKVAARDGEPPELHLGAPLRWRPLQVGSGRGPRITRGAIRAGGQVNQGGRSR
jgi:hypothetical protein